MSDYTYVFLGKRDCDKILGNPKVIIARNLEKNIREEMERLNDIIDVKIIKGLAYKREASRHKFLLMQLMDMRRYYTINSSLLQKLSKVVASFIL